MNRLKYFIVILLIGLLMFAIYKTSVLKNIKATDVQNYVVSFGVYAPVIYIVLFTFVPLTLFPDSILAIAGGMIFGLINGVIYTMIGALCGATVAFFLSKIFGRGLFKSSLSEKMRGVESEIENRGFMVVFMMRLIPLFPFDVISYGAGLSKIKYKDFIIATAIGTLPGIFVFTNIGDQSLNIGSHAFYVSLACLVLLLVVSFVLKKKFLFR